MYAVNIKSKNKYINEFRSMDIDIIDEVYMKLDDKIYITFFNNIFILTFYINCIHRGSIPLLL